MNSPAIRPIRPPTSSDAGTRRIAESLILDMLAFTAWVVDLRAGRQAEARREASRVLELAVAAGLRFQRNPEGTRCFDPVEVDHYLDWSASIGPDRSWLDALRSCNGAIAAANRSSAGVSSDPTGGSARFRVRLRRTFDLTRFGPGASVRLRMPLPLRCEYHADVSVAAMEPPAFASSVTVFEGRLEARLRVPADPLVTIGARIDLTARFLPDRRDAGPLDPAQAQIHLRAAEGLVQVSPGIRDLAARLGGDLVPLEAASAYWLHLHRNLGFRFVGHEQVPPDAPGDWALDTGFSDCVLSSALLVSLCRARGIPARVVNGYTLFPLSPTNHNWAEIWIDGRGWLACDILHRERHEPLDVQGLDWWNHLARRRDYRMVTERLPLAFTGPMSVRLPATWRMLHALADDGVAITFLDMADGSLVYRDEVSSERVD